MAAYRKLEYKVLSEPMKTASQVNSIYDRRDYSEAFERAPAYANEEIVIASSGLRRDKVERFMALVKTRQEAGVSVTVTDL